MTRTRSDAIPIAEPVRSRFESASALLEQAIRAGCKDSNAHYLLAMAYKRQGKLKETRDALRRIAPADANVLLQMGLLSLREGQLAQAEQEFAGALELDSASSAACHNLLFTRLSLGQLESALALLPTAVGLASDPDEQRRLCFLETLLHNCLPANGDAGPAGDLVQMSDEDEQALLALIRRFGHVETMSNLIRGLVAARPASDAVLSVQIETTLLHTKQLLDRGHWLAAKRLLESLSQNEAALSAVARPVQAAFWNLLGCCAVLSQDFDDGIGHFTAALRLGDGDPRIHQNLALVHEFNGDMARAEPHWNRYFDLLDRRVPAPPGQADYVRKLSFEGLCRLATRHSEKERWLDAVAYVERAQRLQPENAEVLERIYHLYSQVGRPDAARRVLSQLKQLRPDEPQLQLYELDIGEPREIEDLERMIGGVSRVRDQHAGDARVEERAAAMIGNVIPALIRFGDNASAQLNKMVDRVHHLPNDQINWRSVREIARDLRLEFQQLRRATNKCLPLVTHPEHRRTLRELAEHLDRKVEQCRRWEED